jgi:hypothetical protein
MLQKGVIMNATETAVPEEGISAIYERFPGLEEIYPREKVSYVRVINIKGVRLLAPKWGIPGILILPGSTSRTGERIKGERLDVDDRGMVLREIGLGESFMNKYDLIEAIRRFSPVSPGAYAVLIQEGNLTIFALNV